MLLKVFNRFIATKIIFLSFAVAALPRNERLTRAVKKQIFKYSIRLKKTCLQTTNAVRTSLEI